MLFRYGVRLQAAKRSHGDVTVPCLRSPCAGRFAGGPTALMLSARDTAPAAAFDGGVRNDSRTQPSPGGCVGPSPPLGRERRRPRRWEQRVDGSARQTRSAEARETLPHARQ